MAQVKPPALGVLAEVLAYGERTGLWTVVERGNEANRYAYVEVPDEESSGATLRFQLSTYDGKVRAAVAPRDDGKPYGQGLQVMPSNVSVNHGDDVPDASASAERGAETIAKSLHKRVIQDPIARGYARRVRERLCANIHSRNALAVHVGALRKLGFTFTGGHSELSGSEYHSVTMYGPGIMLRVNADGGLYIDRMTTSMDHIATVLKIATK